MNVKRTEFSWYSDFTMARMPTYSKSQSCGNKVVVSLPISVSRILNTFDPKKLFNKMYAAAAFSANTSTTKHHQISHLLYSRWPTFYLATIITMTYLLIWVQHHNWLHLNLQLQKLKTDTSSCHFESLPIIF